VEGLLNAPGDSGYEYISKLVRWLGIATVLITFPFNSPGSGTIFILLAVAILYNTSRYLKSVTRIPFFASEINSVVADTIFAVTLLAMTGGIDSPYYFYLLFMAITVAHWYGLRSFTMLFCLYVIISLMFSFATNTTPPALNSVQELFLKLSILTNIGILIASLTYKEREQWGRILHSNQTAEAERQSLLALINSLADAVIAVDGNGKITVYNGAALALLNTNVSLTGQTFARAMPLKDTHGKPVNVLAPQAAGRIIKRNDLTFSSSGETMIIDLSLAPIHLTHTPNAQNGSILVLRDITKEKTLEQQRDEFISVASHELRTPLAIAEANISTALLPGYAKIDKKALSLLGQAHDNIIFLGELIKDLTTLSRAEQGLITIEAKVVDPKAMLETLQRDYRDEAEKKGLRLEVEIEDGIGPIVASEYLIHEILQNYVTNAIKYTQAGSIRLSVKAADKPYALAFTIKDTGIGVSASDQKNLFTKFYRSEDYRTRQTGGTGLGLYITKQLAERLHAKIDFVSKLNHGTTVTLQIPTAKLDSDKNHNSDPHKLVSTH
jgi:signal transduction histidine kinase